MAGCVPFPETESLAKLTLDLDLPAPAPGKPPYTIPPNALRAMVLTLARPAADAAEAIWIAIVQDALDQLDRLDPRDAIEAMFAIQIIGANAGMVDALRLAFEANTDAKQALRQRASAAALGRVLAGAARLLKDHRGRPAGEARDWGDVAHGLALGWHAAAPRPAEAPGGAADGEPIVKWIDELTDAELVVAEEAERREKAGEPPLPGPKVVYRYKPDDYALRWKPDPRAWRKYPGWENMTMPQRREFFGTRTTGRWGRSRHSARPGRSRCWRTRRRKRRWWRNTACSRGVALAWLGRGGGLDARIGRNLHEPQVPPREGAIALHAKAVSTSGDRLRGARPVDRTDPSACIGRVGEDVTTLAPHRPGRADSPHPVPHARGSLVAASHSAQDLLVERSRSGPFGYPSIVVAFQGSRDTVPARFPPMGLPMWRPLSSVGSR